MNCSEIDLRLCDYVDGTLDAEQTSAVELHLAGCASCAELANDARISLRFIERSATVEPPPELLTRILFDLPTRRPETAPARGLRKLIRRWLEPVLQPRFAMGMAMTILSFSMLGKYATPVRQLRPADLSPVAVWTTVEDKVHRTWEKTVKYYESLRVVYEIQSRLREWNQQEQEERKTQPQTGSPASAPAGGGSQAAPENGAPGAGSNTEGKKP